ncbi:guanine nucleotide binding protein, alpha subunit [Halteromyces radiatus]|uniref:guanine nucleotide binding protein, alpha subunit n=1 Tax=Halteromyces radiatus TaxID=101107 RepID=UPI002220BB03|nr:guanine nucleotide binding protein, alpha subunit [Halteromyces radiatus]KAI8093804.1 guanine nucleotide binding protein, alpha subunit [Halteromyces radiatus]
MGISQSVAQRKNKMITKQLKQDEKRMNREVKILLLGAGDSGKSTVLKQMRLIHASGFNHQEREGFRMIIFSNIVNAMQTLLEAMMMAKLTLEHKENWDYIPLFLEQLPTIQKQQSFPPEYLTPLKSLWQDKAIKKTFTLGNTFALNDNVQYYYDQLDRLFQPNYIPTDQDIIQCRIKTTGIVETTFNNRSLVYRMFDVGGQRSERKKWIHCFENVASVLFVVAISGYDCCLAEDKDSMYEALMLFDSICNSQWFKNTSMILFLNKMDIFKRKVLRSSINQYFPDYSGPTLDYLAGADYFRHRFESLNRNDKKQIYIHFTVATDTKLLAHVMGSVSDSILHENLQTLLL